MPDSQRRLYPGGENLTQEEKETWKKQAKAYLEDLRMRDKHTKASNATEIKKEFRLKTYQSLVKLDSIFKDLGLPGNLPTAPPAGWGGAF